MTNYSLLRLDEESLAANLEPAVIADLIMHPPQLVVAALKVKARHLPRYGSQLIDHRTDVEVARNNVRLSGVGDSEPGTLQSTHYLVEADGNRWVDCRWNAQLETRSESLHVNEDALNSTSRRDGQVRARASRNPSNTTCKHDQGPQRERTTSVRASYFDRSHRAATQFGPRKPFHHRVATPAAVSRVGQVAADPTRLPCPVNGRRADAGSGIEYART